MIDRRAITFGFVGLVVVPAPVWGRAPGRIGYLHPVTIDPAHITFSILRRRWQRLGYIDGQTVIVRTAAGDPHRLSGLVHELIDSGADVLIVVGAEPVRVAAKVTATIPIVAIDLETDPVHSGLVASYARPGGNVTGLFLDLPSLATKWIELIREAVPGLERIALVWQQSTGREQLDIALAAVRATGIDSTVVEVDLRRELAAQFAPLAGSKKTALVQLTVPGMTPFAKRYAEAAVGFGLPTITFLRAAAQAGVLMSYGPNQETYFPRSVDIANQILRGAKASDIPIERPYKFELVVNLKTAKALGLRLPPSILVRADEVIE